MSLIGIESNLTNWIIRIIPTGIVEIIQLFRLDFVIGIELELVRGVECGVPGDITKGGCA